MTDPPKAYPGMPDAKSSAFQDFGLCDACGLFDGCTVIHGVVGGMRVGTVRVCRPCTEGRPPR